MINILNIVFKIKTEGPMQNLINELSNKYENQIEYIQANRTEKLLYVVFRGNHIESKRIKKIDNISSVSIVDTDVTLVGFILKQLHGNIN